jgi:hypothetical protein
MNHLKISYLMTSLRCTLIIWYLSVLFDFCTRQIVKSANLKINQLNREFKITCGQTIFCLFTSACRFYVCFDISIKYITFHQLPFKKWIIYFPNFFHCFWSSTSTQLMKLRLSLKETNASIKLVNHSFFWTLIIT